MGKRRAINPEPSGPLFGLHGSAISDQLDLHGEVADVASRKATWFIDRWARQQPGAVVRIITGKGNRSTAGKAVLEPAIRRILDENASEHVREWTTDIGGGSFLVRVGVSPAR